MNKKDSTSTNCEKSRNKATSSSQDILTEEQLAHWIENSLEELLAKYPEYSTGKSNRKFFSR